jgi:hypothetical protein
MTLNYYIKVYHLTETEAENLRSLASAEEDPESKSSLLTYAHRWMMEIAACAKRKSNAGQSCSATSWIQPSFRLHLPGIELCWPPGPTESPTKSKKSSIGWTLD